MQMDIFYITIEYAEHVQQQQETLCLKFSPIKSLWENQRTLVWSEWPGPGMKKQDIGTPA